MGQGSTHRAKSEWWLRIAREARTLHFKAKFPSFKITAAVKRKTHMVLIWDTREVLLPWYKK